jgi:hypothetical protein
VATLVTSARERLLVVVGSIERAGDAVPAAASIWALDGDNLLMNEGVAIDADGIADAAVDFAASSARAHTAGPVTDALLTQWLEEGVSKAIARFVLGGLERMGERMKVMTRTPPPTRDELEDLRRQSARDQAEIDRLIGSGTDRSNLPTATLRER